MFTRESLIEGIVAHRFNAPGRAYLNDFKKKAFDNTVAKHANWTNQRIADEYYGISGLFIKPLTSTLFTAL
jgi:hypothetical protein